MFLSRVVLNPTNRRVQRELADPYQMHRSLMCGFPSELDKAVERVLFRVETSSGTGPPVLLVQSQGAPDWSWLDEPGARGYLLPEEAWPPNVDVNPATKAFDLRPRQGQVLAFRLRANPTVRRDGKRRGLSREEDQLAWLERKAREGGFRLLAARTSDQTAVSGSLRRYGRVHRLQLLSVLFDGSLEVLDPDRLQQAVRQGVGSGKGMGFGLLSLARPQGM